MRTPQFGWLFIVLGAAICAYAVVQTVRAIAQRRRHGSWTPTTARITKVTTVTERTPQSNTYIRYVAHYVYRAADGTDHHGSQLIRNQRIRHDSVGSPLAIIVDPHEPDRSLVASETPALGCAVLGILLVAAVGIVFIWAGSGIASGRP